ncbi:Tyrosine recombinase XerC [Paraburkholderia aspalathi]|uniref:IS1096 element passenger TnpR family protein n=1 Tax=Paraburkholderia aspalathi TaxID=1324617 RepID=UPI001B2F53A8|nr:phage integrase family protein [Paraburkholderia aspalathi]CAE6850444.1 Tyrosine recombinase XerC [Paraburkholderia aspalathi]
MTDHAGQLTFPPPRTYTRTDFAALRALVQRVPLRTIARLYFDADTTPYHDDPAQLERHLRAMRDDLVHLAQLHGSSVLADHLKASARQHGSARLTAVTLRMVEDASRLAVAVPRATHPVGLWFRPLIAKRLTGEGITTLGELVACCNRRGGSWWRAVPRVGLLRARILVAWLRRHAGTLGVTVDADVDAAEPLAAPMATHVALVPAGCQTAQGGPLAPLERIELPHRLCGGEGPHGTGQRGVNRAPGLCYLQARHDLDAIRSYLHRYTDRPQALRAYTRELERLLLWAVTERGTALSSLSVDDCDAYKAFLTAPAERFTGPRTARSSPRWRPFAPSGLTPGSQKYAVAVLRAAFDWLVKVRYLAGNPWAAVTDPATDTSEYAIRVDRALPLQLWTKVRVGLDERSGSLGPSGPQWRAAKAAILLMGDSGLRITEVTLARRERLSYLSADGDIPAGWTLQVLGKGRKQRSVPVSTATLAALRAHWADRGLDFNDPPATAPLIRPVTIPPTPAAQRRHVDASPEAAGYSINGLRGVVSWAFGQLQGTLDLTDDERRHLAGSTPHALRHTFGTQAVAASVPPDVAQRVLGHASLATTTLYAQAETKRVRRELAGYFEQMQALTTSATAGAVEDALESGHEATPSPVAPAGNIGPVEQIARIRLTLQVQASSGRSPRGTSSEAWAERMLGELERWILETGDAETVEPGVVVLTVRYRQAIELDMEVEAWLDDLSIEAQDRHCTCAIDAQWGERRWTHSGLPDERSTRDVVPFPESGKPAISPPRIWRVRVSLLGVAPEIWRRIEIPADISLAGLHGMLQAAMGWGDMHRYGFGLYGFPDRVDLDVDRADGVRLLNVCQPGDTIGYTYDMGDYWHHAVEIEAEVPPSSRIRYPRCVAGRRACPPEDSGGPPGYAHLLRTLAGRMTGARRELLDWLGGPFDPDVFRVAEVNARLANMGRYS